MQKNLVIVESPAKAKTIERFLGDDFKVMSSFGHIRDLDKKNDGVDPDTFQPHYEIPADKQKVVSELRAAAKKAEIVWLASDEDREGEAISWHLAEVLKLDPATARRIVFHEITKPAILDAIAHPRTIDLNLVDAQQARRVLDRVLGFRLSPVLWRKVRRNLSAGRVQSVTVRLIVEREREIEAFQAESAFRVTAFFGVPGDNGQMVSLKAELNHRFTTIDEVNAFLENCKTAEFRIESLTTKPAKRTPAPPFTTSTLQQEAARKFGYAVASTMRIAQNLYESGLITYMRTDSMNLSTLCLDTAEPVIAERMGANYHKRRNYHTKSKGAQEAHEAIRPTDMSREDISGTPQERKLYNLIWKRTLASQMADAQLEKTTAVISVSGSEYQFAATGEVVKFDGFLRLYRESVEENEGDSEESGLLPPMSEGQVLQRQIITAQERFTQAPTRYSEASLVHKLEELGIGRPSTYAPTISTIQKREYVAKGESEGKARSFVMATLEGNDISTETRTENFGSNRGKLVPTDTGIVVNDFLLSHFPEFMDYNFTAKVEHDFDRVAEGEEEWTNIIRSFCETFNPQVDRVMAERSETRVGERHLGAEPESGRPVSVKIGRFGPMVQIGGGEGDDETPKFASLKTGQSITTITLEEALELFKLPRTVGEFEGTTVTIGAGRFGPYVLHAKKYTSIPKGEDPMSVTLERAIELIEEKRAKDASNHLRSFEEEPELEVLNGRYGPYIKYKGNNYRIPKDRHGEAASLTLEECMKLIEAEGEKAPKKVAKTSTKTAKSTSKTASKPTKSATKAKKSTSTTKQRRKLEPRRRKQKNKKVYHVQ
ncbi:type I DNA topoisomerase [Alloprevotella sp. oral taxon 473]|uniref:type I DNA topoisomerase n=1 Tax=Alloprevotella sp. oral taxon 473 TaxID=712469 RepID=UPI0005C71604|nr:type I DNA topoisomerase [Alloprevotella sp. oral taxon 473]